MEKLVKIKSIYFIHKKKSSKTSIVCLNYKIPNEFVGHESAKKIYEEFEKFEEADVDEGIELKGLFRKDFNLNSDLIEDFTCSLNQNIVQERLYACIENEVHPFHIKSFPTVRFSKKISKSNCNLR